MKQKVKNPIKLSIFIRKKMITVAYNDIIALQIMDETPLETQQLTVTVNLTPPLPSNPNQTIKVDELEAVLTLPAINDTCSTSLSALPMV